MKRKNWYWDLNIPYKKIKQILGREDDPRFPRLAGVLLARVRDPRQIFELITPSAFCRRFRAIEKEITSDEWTKENEGSRLYNLHLASSRPRRLSGLQTATFILL